MEVRISSLHPLMIFHSFSLEINLCLFSGQVLSHVNIGNYLASKVPSLRNYSNGHKNGDSKFSSLQALSSAMQFLHKYGPALNNNHIIYQTYGNNDSV